MQHPVQPDQSALATAASLPATRPGSPPQRPDSWPDVFRFNVQGPEGRLAVRTWGHPANPTIVLVHGYPDNSSKWDAVAQRLCDRYYVVAYDVRGAGESFTPHGGTESYRLEKLTADFKAVIDAVSPDRPVHLVAHDWGSIQSWEFTTEPSLAGRIASYTSVSGPCLDHVAYWLLDRVLRPTPRALLQLLRQAISSWYIYFFHLPWLPEALWRSVLGKHWHVVLARLEATHVAPRASQTRDGANGVGLYRANFIPRLFRPSKRIAHAPVQVIVPKGDHYVSPALSDNLTRWVPALWRREVEAGHWLTMQRPELFADLVQEFIACVDGAPESPALQRARVAVA